MSKPRSIDSSVVFDIPWFKIQKEVMDFGQEGKVHDFYILIRNPAIFIIPEEVNSIFLIKQYRLTVKEYLYEIPAGLLIDNEDPKLCAQRELREETGLTAAHIEKVGSFFLAPGYSNQKAEVYLATGLSRGQSSLEETEAIIEATKVTRSELKTMIKTNQIKNGPTLAALSLYLLQTHD